MFKKLINYLFQTRAKKYLRETERDRRFVNYDKAKSILLLFESDYNEKNLTIRRIINRLHQDGIKVSAWGYIDKKEVTTSILPDFRILHHKQTDFFQKPLISFVNELEGQEYDLMIDLTLTPLIPLQYVAVFAKASCKIGIHKLELPIYDFVLDVESLTVPIENTDFLESPVDVDYLFEKINYYLKSIQTTD
jgi:hypothetical protein